MKAKIVMVEIIQYKCKIHLTLNFKPSCKAIIIPYSYNVSASKPIKLPSKYKELQCHINVLYSGRTLSKRLKLC